ncbi:MAG TPA: hypothetical protein VGK48_02190 [Terriglobia bacterium]|jgi:hypothetical protein
MAVTKIYENSNLTVKAKVERRDVAAIEDVTFKFLKDGEQFEEKTIPIGQGHPSGDQIIVSHVLQVPAVAEDKDSYFLEYHYFYKVKSKDSSTESLQNFPDTRIQVFPRLAQVKVTDKDGKAFRNFQFRVQQNGEFSESYKTVASDTPNAKGETIPAGSAEFNLGLFPNFRIVPLPPYEMTEQVVATGRKREVKGEVGFRAVFIAPQAGNIKQYVNYEPQGGGQAGLGDAVTIEVGVHPEDTQYLKAISTPEIHFRVTCGPASGEPVAKSERNDANHPTKAMKVSDLDTTATIEEKEAGKKYEGKITLAGGAGRFAVALGKAGGDTCTVEISGSNKFLTDSALSADATLKFENWRRVYYELMVPDIMMDQALELIDRDWNLQSAVLEKLATQGRQLFIEFVCAKIHRFNAQKYADSGSLIPRSFLGLPGSSGAEPVYVLTGRNWRKLPTGKSWLVEYPGKALYIHVCEALLKWRKDTTDEKAGATDFSGTLTESTGFVNMQDKFQGLFMPFSGYDAGDGIASITWTADISKDDTAAKYTPELEIVNESASGPQWAIFKKGDGDGADNTLTVTLKNSSPPAARRESIVFRREGAESFPAELGEGQTRQIQQFVDGCLGDKAGLVEAGAKMKVTISGTGDSKHGEPDCLNAVKSKLQELFDATKKEFSWHPGLDSKGEPRSGSLPLRDATDVQQSTVTEWHFRLPFAGPGGKPGPGSIVGADKSRNACPIKVEFSVQPHEFSTGEAEGKLIAWVCDPATGPKQLVRLVLNAFSGTTDNACVAHTHGDGMPGDCLQEADVLCADCIKHGRSRDLTNIK